MENPLVGRGKRKMTEKNLLGGELAPVRSLSLIKSDCPAIGLCAGYFKMVEYSCKLLKSYLF